MENSVSFITGNNYKFSFYKSGKSKHEDLFDDKNINIEPGKNTKFVLFSGGLDSLAGIIDLLETSSDKICLIVFQSLSSLTDIQNKLFSQLNKLYPGRCIHFKFYCGMEDMIVPDHLNKTRSLLYTSAAFLISNTLKQDKIYFFSNGIDSVNLKKTASGRNNSLSNPAHLGTIENLFSRIKGNGFKILQPFLLKTKREIIEVLKKYERLDLMEISVSCNRISGKTPGHNHCGVCPKCLNRIFASYAAGIEPNDAINDYMKYFPTDDLEDEKLVRNLVRLLRRTNKFAEKHINQFSLKWQKELIQIQKYTEGDSFRDKIVDLYNLYQRYVDDMESAIKNMSDIYHPFFGKLKPNAFFDSIINPEVYKTKDDIYIKEKTVDYGMKKEIPFRGLKQLVKQTCEILIRRRIITDILNETRKNKSLSKLIIEELRNNKFNISRSNEVTISDYFRKYELQMKRNKNGELIVYDNYLEN